MLFYILYILAKLGIEVVPRPICVRVGKLVAAVCFMYDGPARRAVIANLSHVLAFNGEDTASDRGRKRVIRLARETFENFAIHFIDFMRISRIDSDIRIGLLKYRNFERFREAFARGKGLISVTAHIGNWEMGAAATAKNGLPLNTVALQTGERRVDRLFTKLRESGGMRLISPGHAARGFFHALQRKELVAFVADRDVNGNGAPVKFFGSEVKIPRGPAEIAARSNAPIIPAFCVQEADGRFTLYVEEAIKIDRDAPYAEKVDAINTGMVRIIERYISRYPSQWFAFYNVWN